jgi:hypothetical protein
MVSRPLRPESLADLLFSDSRAFVLLRRASHFLSLAREKSNQREGHPASALSEKAWKVRGRTPGFVDSPSGNRSCVASTRASMHSPCKPPCALSYTRPPLQRGVVSQKQRACACQSKIRTSDALVAFALAVAVAIAVAAAVALDLQPPCDAVSRGRQARRGIGTMPIPFRQHMEVLSKSPAAAHGLDELPRAGMPELRQRRSGCPSPASAEEAGLLFGGFLLATQEKATRAPQAHESLGLPFVRYPQSIAP